MFKSRWTLGVSDNDVKLFWNNKIDRIDEEIKSFDQCGTTQNYYTFMPFVENASKCILDVYQSIDPSSEYGRRLYDHVNPVEGLKLKYGDHKELINTYNEFVEFYKTDVRTHIYDELSDGNSYGNIIYMNYDKLSYQEEENAKRYINSIISMYNNKQYADIWSKGSQLLNYLANYIHYFAFYNDSYMHTVYDIFTKLNKRFDLDVELSRLYWAYKNNKTHIPSYHYSIIDHLVRHRNTNGYKTLASFYCWMKDTSKEKETLANYDVHWTYNKNEFLLNKYHEILKFEEDERIRNLKNERLKNTNSNIIKFKKLDVKSYDNPFHSTSFTLTNNNDNHIDQVCFWAIREDSHSIVLNQLNKLPDNNTLSYIMQRKLNEEFGECVDVRSVNSQIENNHIFESIMIEVNDISYIKILVVIFQLGKKLNVKFYTLFTPTYPYEAFRQQAVSLYNQSNPLITSWEDSLKESSLSILQWALNNNPTEKTNNSSNDSIVF